MADEENKKITEIEALANIKVIMAADAPNVNKVIKSIQELEKVEGGIKLNISRSILGTALTPDYLKIYDRSGGDLEIVNTPAFHEQMSESLQASTVNKLNALFENLSLPEKASAAAMLFGSKENYDKFATLAAQNALHQHGEACKDGHCHIVTPKDVKQSINDVPQVER